MNRVSQLQTLYGWTPNFRQVFKRPVPQDYKTFKVAQTYGIFGWIIFTFENKIPVCYWVNSNECTKIQCVVDPRICGDTFLRVEKLSDLEYIVSDIWVYNSNCVYACSTFSQRYVWLKQLLSKFVKTIPGVTVSLLHKSEIQDENIRGYEVYLETEIGSPGYYIEKDQSQLFTIHRMNIPDCYQIVENNQYLYVPDLKTSVFLRKKENEFKCRCIHHEEDFWRITENIPDIN